jgi:hypothetical protein
MFLINPIFAAIAIITIMFVYGWQVRLGHQAPWGDVRSGVFNAIAEWAVRMAARMPQSAKSWKPNLMVPIEDPYYWEQRMSLVRNIVFPKGSVRVLSVKILEHGLRQQIGQLVEDLFKMGIRIPKRQPPSEEELEDELKTLIHPLKEEGILTASTVIEANHFLEGISIVTQSMRGMPLPPNIMFLSMSDDR